MADIKIPSRVTELRVPVINAAQLDMARRLQKLSYASILDPIDLFDEHGQPKKISDMPGHARRAIAGFEIDPEKFTTKIKLVDKRRAIMDYSKLAGDIPSENHDITTEVTIEQLVSMIVKKEPKEP